MGAASEKERTFLARNVSKLRSDAASEKIAAEWRVGLESQTRQCLGNT